MLFVSRIQLAPSTYHMGLKQAYGIGQKYPLQNTVDLILMILQAHQYDNES